MTKKKLTPSNKLANETSNLEEIVRFKEKNRQYSILPTPHKRLIYKVFSIFGLSIAVQLIFSDISSFYQKNLWKESLTYNVLAYLLISIWSWNRTLENPLKGRERENWLWKQGKRDIILSAICLVLFILSSTFNEQQSELAKRLIVIGCVFSLLYSFVVLIVIVFPYLFFSNFIAGLGAALSVIGLVMLSLGLFFQNYEREGQFPLGGIFAIAISLYYLRFQFIQTTKEDRINATQYVVLRIVDPKRILYSLKTRGKLLEDQIEALKIIEKYENKGRYGLLSSLSETLAIRYRSKMQTYWFLFFSILGFIVSAVAEGFFQDLLYDPIVKPFICSIFSSFCN